MGTERAARRARQRRSMIAAAGVPVPARPCVYSGRFIRQPSPSWGGRSGGSESSGRVQAPPPGSASSASPSANPVGRREERMPRSAVARPCRTTESVPLAVATRRAMTSRAAKGSAGTAAPARCAAVTLAVLGLFAGAPAAAQEPTGGTSPTVDAAPAPAAPAAPEPTANLYGSAAPRVGRFVCRRSCGAGGAARPGSLVRVRGRHLKAVGEVLFLGAPGEADDASVAPRAAWRRSLLARVPLSAVSGPIALALADGTRSAGSRRPLTVEPRPVEPPAGVIDAEVQRQKVFFGEQ